MIDMTKEKLLTLAEVSARLPPGRMNKPVSFSCILRWITNGVPGPDGSLVLLEGIRIGGRWLTSVEALDRWSMLLTPKEGELPIPKRCRAHKRSNK